MEEKDIWISIVAVKLGLIPKCNNSKEFKEAMASLSPEERRLTKRKFRKIWRKLAKSNPRIRNYVESVKKRTVPGEEQPRPTGEEMKKRRAFVFDEITRLAEELKTEKRGGK